MRTKLLAIVLAALSVTAQERIEVLNDFESWTERSIKESAIIGGKTKTLYKPGGVWGCSNAYAKVMGVEKVSVSVTPEKRGNGTCCRMESTLEIVSAIGINFKALATGSIYTGKMVDVISAKQTSDPNSAIDMGIPFTARPTALILDYKALIKDEKAVYAPAKTQVKEVEGRDAGIITLYLQHRWEENGHVYAYRHSNSYNRGTFSQNRFGGGTSLARTSAVAAANGTRNSFSSRAENSLRTSAVRTSIPTRTSVASSNNRISTAGNTRTVFNGTTVGGTTRNNNSNNNNNRVVVVNRNESNNRTSAVRTNTQQTVTTTQRQNTNTTQRVTTPTTTNQQRTVVSVPQPTTTRSSAASSSFGGGSTSSFSSFGGGGGGGSIGGGASSGGGSRISGGRR